MASRKRRRSGGGDDGDAAPAPAGKKHASTPAPLVVFSAKDKASNVSLSRDSSIVSCTKGFRTVRSELGVAGGCWFTEFVIPDRVKTGSHLRLGWAGSKADPQCPVGTDGWGYGVRDVSGSKVHQGVRHWFGTAFGPGDVVGLLLHIPGACWDPPSTPPATPAEGAGIPPDAIPASWVSHLQLSGGTTSLPDGTPITVSPEPLPPLPAETPAGVSWGGLTPPISSYIRVYLNGIDQGVAFVNLTGAVGGPGAPGSDSVVPDAESAISYYAAASVMGGASVRLNAGPTFAFPPPLAAPLKPAGEGTAPGPALPQPWMPLSAATDVWVQKQSAGGGTVAAIDMAVHPAGIAAAAAAVGGGGGEPA